LNNRFTIKCVLVRIAKRFMVDDRQLKPCVRGNIEFVQKVQKEKANG